LKGRIELPLRGFLVSGHSNTIARGLIAVWVALCALGCHRTNDAENTAATPADKNDLKSIIAKAIEAQGDFAQWSKGYVKYTLPADMTPLAAITAVSEDTFNLPGQQRRVLRMKSKFPDRAAFSEVIETTVINQGEGWQKTEWFTTKEQPEKLLGEARSLNLDRSEKETMHRLAYYWDLTPAAKSGTKLTKMGEEQVNDHSAVVIRMQGEKDRPLDLSFDKENGLLVAMIAGNERVILEDYQKVQGGMVPMRIRVTPLSGSADSDKWAKPYEFQLLEVKLIDKFDEHAFAKP
jgi:hypothetical protein